MPESRTTALIWTAAARADLIRLRSFIEPHNPEAARRSADNIKEAVKLLTAHPAIGKRVEERQDRELFIPFGQRGYVMRYRLEDKAIVVLRVWHGLEARDEQQ